jgi:hypothetical protein
MGILDDIDKLAKLAKRWASGQPLVLEDEAGNKIVVTPQPDGAIHVRDGEPPATRTLHLVTVAAPPEPKAP